MKRLSSSLLVLTLAALAAPAQQLAPRSELPEEPEVERPPRYRIEVIVFAHERFDSGEEYFDIVPADSQFAIADLPPQRRYFDTDDRQALRDLVDEPVEPLPLAPITDEELEAFAAEAMYEGPQTRFLLPEELTLGESFQRLETLDGYTPLLHAGWEQNGLAETDAVAIDLAELGASNPRGTLQLHMSRYLHMAVDLAWRPQGFDAFGADNATTQFGGNTQFGGGFGNAGPFGGIAARPATPEYYLFEQRRILRGELNYFDHPAFGLLLMITLAPEPEDEFTEVNDGPSA